MEKVHLVVMARNTLGRWRPGGHLVPAITVSAQQTEASGSTAYAQGRATNRGGDTRRTATEEISGMQAVGCMKGVSLSSWFGAIAFVIRWPKRGTHGIAQRSRVYALLKVGTRHFPAIGTAFTQWDCWAFAWRFLYPYSFAAHSSR
jgi:hypothetical protein